MILGTPIAWNKAQIGSEILWIGWLFNLNLYNVQVVPDKVDRLQAMIIEILSAKTVRRKLLERALGMLMWFTIIGKYLRPHLAPIYKDLYCPPATLFSIPASSWSAFIDILGTSATVVKSHPHFALPLGAKLWKPNKCCGSVNKSQ